MEGYKVSADNSTLAFPCNINQTPKSLSSLKRLNCVITIVFELCWFFLLRASATTFAFPGDIKFVSHNL